MKIKKVLIIDDDKDLAHLVRDFLKDKGYEPLVAYDGKEGLEVCRKEKPDLITLDLLMPKIDGVRFLDIMQNDVELSSIPVVIVSVVAEKDNNEINKLHLGVIDWLKKPIDFDEFHKIIQESEKLLLDDSTEKRKIVLIEDDKAVAETMAVILEASGYIPVVYNSIVNVVENIVKENPFMILMDVLLPEVNGLEIIKQLKVNSETARIPIVVVSGLDLYEHRNKCLLAGATEYYVGSFSSQTFLDELQTNIMKYEVLRTEKHARVLVADDDADLAHLAMDYLSAEGFDVIYAKDGEEAVTLTYKDMPDMILLDIGMPKKDGYQVFKEIKADILLSTIPIIILTAKGKTRDKILGLNLGADDYITKPYDLDELVARVKMILRRTTSNRELNPLTRIPGNVSIEEAINECIRNDRPFAVLYLDINNFKSFNDYYSFTRGDEVIRATGRTILETMNELGYRDDFVGHIGGDDFIVVTFPERIEILCNRIIEKYDKLIPALYDPEDRERGFIITKDRQNNTRNFPFVSLAIGVTSTRYKKLTSLGEVSKIGSEMKVFTKKFKGVASNFSIDERKI